MSAPNSEAGPKPPPRITIDGKVIELQPGDTIMRAAERAGLDIKIPRFCYHPGLPIAGTCRMCTVEVEKAPKLMTACSTPANDGMIIHTQSDRVRKSRNGVMEFLLLNHPLDCPVCDQAGECYLQDYNYDYGPGTSRYVEQKRVWKGATTKKLSDEITLNMNRCIHCERCVRFTETVTKTNDLFMINRGWKKQLVTPEDVGLKGDYQGCLADICPVGALTFNDFRFKKRVWFLKKAPSICDQCSKGCNILVEHEKNVIYRLTPRVNMKVNGHWMCDEGRKSYHQVMDPNRLVLPLIQSQQNLSGQNTKGLYSVAWDAAVTFLTEELKKAKSVLVIIGTDASIEEAQAMTKMFPKFTTAKTQVVFYNGVNGVNSSKDDVALDTLLRRKDKTPNTKGIESLGLAPLTSADKADLVIHLRFGRAALAPKGHGSREIAWGVFTLAELDAPANKDRFIALLPGLTTSEKSGTFVNCDGIAQKFVPAIQHQGEGKQVEAVIATLSQGAMLGKPVRAEKSLS